KQIDSLSQRLDAKNKKLLILRDDLINNEQSYRQLQQAINNLSEQINSSIMRGNLPIQQTLSWKSNTSKLSGAKNKIKVSSAKQ
ncbi:TPA: hypothetical protein U1349_001532, partial [Streptococcus suis]|nr:hypothetical protein [Streptococcus suis]